MNEPTVNCPNCQSEIKLTESLAAPLIATMRHQFEQKMVQKEADINTREAALREQQAAIAKAQESIDELVAEKLKSERSAIVTIEAKKAQEAMADEISKFKQEKTAYEQLLRDRDAKLAPSSEKRA